MAELPLWTKWAGMILGSGVLTVLFNLAAGWAGLWADTRSDLQETLMQRVHQLEDRVARMQDEQATLRTRLVKLWHAYQTQRERIRRFLRGYNDMREKEGLDPIGVDEVHVDVDLDADMPLDDLSEL